MFTYVKIHIKLKKTWVGEKNHKMYEVTRILGQSSPFSYHERLYSNVDSLVEFLPNFKGPSRKPKSANVNIFIFLLPKVMAKKSSLQHKLFPAPGNPVSGAVVPGNTTLLYLFLKRQIWSSKKTNSVFNQVVVKGKKSPKNKIRKDLLW